MENSSTSNVIRHAAFGVLALLLSVTLASPAGAATAETTWNGDPDPVTFAPSFELGSTNASTQTCAECKGGVTRLKLQYNGDTARRIVVVDDDDAIFDATVQPGGMIVLNGTENDGKFDKNELLVYVRDGNDWVLDTKIHVSCSKPINPGLKFGSFEVLEADSKDNGEVCSIDEGGCDECAGGVTRLTLQYNGNAAAHVEIEDSRDVYLDRTVQPGEIFEIIGTKSDGKFQKNELDIFIDGDKDADIHVSCSDPIGPGSTFGSFTVIAGQSRSGGAFCPIDPPDPEPDPRKYCVADRMTSPYGFWLPGLDTRNNTKLYSISNAIFDEANDGTAHLTGTITNEIGEGFTLDLTFTGRTTSAPAGSPKNGYNYSVNTADFVYYTGMTGFLNGIDNGDYDGAVVQVGRRGEAFQYGTGANLFDRFKFGASSWLDWSVITEPTGGVNLRNTGVGDINVTFDEDCFADISLEKMATPMFASVGEEISFTITVTNQGSTTATNVEVTDYLPTQIAYVGGSANEGGSPSGNDVSWTIPSLAGGQSIDLTFLGTAVADGSARNCAEVSGMDSQDTDSTPGNLSGAASEDDESCYTVSIRPDGPMCMITDSTDCITAELISVTDGAGETQYMVKITNNCMNAVSFVAFQLPSGATVSDPSGSYSDGSFNYGIEFPTSNPFPHSLKFETQGEGPKAGQMTTFDFTLDGGFELDEPFMIEVKYGPNRDQLQLNTDCTPEIDLEIAKTVIGSGVFSTGDEVTYELKVTNTSSETATGVTVQDSFPESFAFVSASGDGSYDQNTGVWTVGTVGANDMATIQVTMRADVSESGSPTLGNGLYRLNNHPDGSARWPLYGLRLDKLFHDHQPITFDFEHNDSDVWMQVDGSSIIIFGQVFGGKDGGSTYIAGQSGLWDLYFRYDNVIAPVPGDDDLYTTVETGSGTISPRFATGDFAAGKTFNLSAHRSGGVSLRIGDHDNDAGHRGYTDGAGISGWGWLKHDGKGSLQHHAASDWLFTTGAFQPDTFVNCVEIASADQDDIDSTPSNGYKAGEDDNACEEITVTVPPPGRIAGNVYDDTNLNNIIDPGTDADLSGVKVLLFADNDNDGIGDVQVAMTTTAGDGSYEFDNLDLGDYVVLIDENLDPPGSLEAITANPADVALTMANPSDEDVDFLFGQVRLASFGDTVYRDDNGNGQQDSGEPGIQGVTVRLFMDNGGTPGIEITPSQVTNSGGHYEFTGLDPKGYIAEVVGPTGYMISDNNDDGNMDTDDFRLSQVLVAGQNYNDADFGFKPTGKISGFVWNDTDGEGDFDETNAGISGAIVALLDENGIPVLDANNQPITATTDGDGMYMFSNLPPGTYLVDVTSGQPNDTAATTPEPATVVLPLNGMGEADFGYAPTGSIAGKVREDTAGDVNLDGNEPGINGVTVVLYNDVNDDGVVDGSDTIAASTVTSGDGMYLFEDLPAGDYLVDVDNSDPQLGSTFPVDELDFPEPRDVSLAVDEDKTDVDFLFGSVKMATLGDRVWLDYDGDGVQDPTEPGLLGAKVFLQDASGASITDGTGASMIETLADGLYDFVGLMPGTYQVEIMPPSGYELTTPPNPMTGIVLTSGKDENGVDFGLIPAEGKIKVVVFNDTDGNGVQNGGETGYQSVMVSVTSFGPNGVNDGGGDDVNLTLTTDSNGMAMTAQNLKPGSYDIEVIASTLPSTADIPTTPTSVTVNIDGTDTEEEEFGYQIAESMISGVVFDDANDTGTNDSEPGLNGVTVTLYADTDVIPDGVGDVVVDETTTAQVSGVDGFYKFNNLPAGNYVVDVDNNDTDLGGRIPTTMEPRSESVNGMNSVANVDFGFVAPASKNRGSIGDFVWRDDNNNQVQNPGEIGVAGAEITLYNSDVSGTKGTVVGTRTTDGLGFYQFDGLLPGFYVAEITTIPGTYSASTGTMTGAIDLDPGENFNGADFGLLTSGMVEGKIFMDVNGNGTYESTPDMLITQSVIVRLIDDEGGEFASQSTSDGTYKFNNVPPGDYEVLVATVIPDKITSTGNPVDVTVPLNDAAWADVGFEDNTGMISGIVFEDLNGDGDKDTGEDPIDDAKVTLYLDYENDGVGDEIVGMVDTGDSGPAGTYKFNNLVQGFYIVDVLDSDVAPLLPTSAEPKGVHLAIPGDTGVADFGFSAVANKMASIGDRVYRDDNGNGVQDAGEPGVSGVTVSLSGPESDSAVTDGTGFYEFTNLMPGTYTLDITAGAGSYNRTQGSAGYNEALDAGEDENDADFGLRPKGTMEGTAFMDNNGNGILDALDTAIPNATINLLNPDMSPVMHQNVAVSTVTDANGGYWFFNLAPGTYLVDLDDAPILDLATKVTSTGDPIEATVPLNGNTAGNDIGYEPATGKISGTVFNDEDGNTVQNGEPGLVDVTVNLFKDEDGTLIPAGTVETDLNGDYQFTGLTQGDYVVDVDDNDIPSGLIATTAEPKGAQILTPTGTDEADFGYSLVANKMARIGDRVFRDDNGNLTQEPGEPGIAGVTVKLTGDASAMTTTDAFGAYEFAGLMPGTYTVTVDTADPEVNGYTDPATTSFTKTVAAGEEYLTADFPFGPKGFLEGFVFMDNDGDGVYTSGTDMLIDNQTVTVTLLDDQGVVVDTQEVSDGSYAFTNLAPGEYQVLVDETFAGKITSTGNPVDATVPLNAGAWANVGFEDNTGMISGVVFNDVDGNVIQGPLEPGLPGVKITLFEDTNGDGVGDQVIEMIWTADGTGSEAKGFYKFNNLVQGLYVVDVLDANVGSLLATSAEPKPVELDPGESQEADFGFSTVANKMASIGDRVYRDDNGNGFQDAGEPGLSLVTVSITGPNGFSDSEVTDGSGFYEFTGLMPGDYTVSITNGATGYTPTQGAGGYAMTLSAGEEVNDDDFGLRPTGTIEGFAFMDLDGNGIFDGDDTPIKFATIELLNLDGTPVMHQDGPVLSPVTTETDGNGGYWFFNVAPGDFLVNIETSDEPADKITSTGDPITVTVPKNGNTAGNNIGYEPATATISGIVFKDLNGDGDLDVGDEPGLPNVKVTLYNDFDNDGSADSQAGMMTTGPSGDYMFSNLPQGTYIVDVNDAHVAPLLATSAEPKSVVIDDPLDAETANFGFSELANKMASIGDRVYRDDNNNNVQDLGEPGLDGVTVNITGPNGFSDSDDTDASGFYEFNGLMPGEYTVTVDGADVVGFTAKQGTGGYIEDLIAGEDFNDADFGYVPTGSIAGNIFEDDDGDGSYEPGAFEDGLPDGTVVDLLDDQGMTVATTVTTGGDGSFIFTDLAPGDYQVSVPTEPVGTEASTGNPIDVSVALNAPTTGADVGFEPATSSIAGTVFGDENENQVFDSGTESNLGNGIPLTLYEDNDNSGTVNAGDTLVDDTATDVNGDYVFANLPQGDYLVDVGAVPGLLPTTDDPLAVTTDGTNPVGDQDFGFVDPNAEVASIGDTVFQDTNGTGGQETGEPGIAGAEVSLFAADGVSPVNNADGAPVGPQTTDVSGGYLFSNLVPGTYVVRVTIMPPLHVQTFDPDGTTQDAMTTVTVVGGQEFVDADFGYQPKAGMISGTAFIDTDGDGVQDNGEDGLNDASVTLTGAGPDGLFGTTDDLEVTIWTNTEGEYKFTDLPPGMYVVDVENPDNTVPTTPDPQDVNVGPNGNVTGVDFGYEPADNTIAGTVFEDKNGDGDQDIGDNPATPAVNEDEPALPGLIVTLVDAGPDGLFDTPDDVLVDSDTTDASGNYSFENIPSGTYRIESDAPAGLLATTPNPVTETVNSGDTRDIDFGFNDNKMASIGDLVFEDIDGDGIQDAGDTGIGGLTVKLFRDTNGNGMLDGADSTTPVATTTTNAAGFYSFQLLNPGTYFVDVLPPAGGGFVPTGSQSRGAERAPIVVVSGTTVQDADYGYQPIDGSILVTIFEDSNGNGTQEAGEPGLLGVNVTLTDPDGGTQTGTTDANGEFWFTDLKPGIYSVSSETPAGTVQTAANPSVDLGGNEDATAELGFRSENSSITGTTFGDSDGDGVFDGTESFVGEVPVKLIGPGPDGVFGGGDDVVLATTISSLANGTYTFSGLAPGQYKVEVTPPGSTVVTTSNPLSITLMADETETANFGLNSNKMASIGDTVFEDLNGNGIQDAGDVGLAGIDVILYEDDGNGVFEAGNDSPIRTETTNSAGIYDFTGLMPGTYFVDVQSSPSYAATGDSEGLPTDPNNITGPELTAITVADGQDVNGADYGLMPKRGKIHGIVFDDTNGNGVKDPGESPIPWITIRLRSNGPDGNPSTTSDNVNLFVESNSQGKYWFENLAPGTYKVNPVTADFPTGATVTTDFPTTVVVGSNTTVDDVDHGFQTRDSAISGTAFEDKNGNGVDDGASEGPIAGATVTLLNLGSDGLPGGGDDSLAGTATTDGTGNFAFGGLPPGTYQVTVTPPAGQGGQVATTANPKPVVIGPADSATANFGFNNNKMASIGDLIFRDDNGDGDQDPGEPGLSAVTVKLYRDTGNGTFDVGDTLVGTKTTDNAGFYDFTALAPGIYFVDVVTPSGFMATGSEDLGDEGQPISVVSGDDENRADYGFLPMNGVVAGTVFNDLNGNGTQDTGEPGLPDVPVTVSGPGLDGVVGGGDDIFIQTTTNAQGEYTVTGLIPDDYTVEVDTSSPKVPAGAVATTGNPIDVEVEAGQTSEGNIGFQTRNSIVQGTTFIDANGNGVFDSGDSTVDGVPVKLINLGLDNTIGGGDDTIQDNSVSASGGIYTFNNVPPGTYQVEAVAPNGLVSTSSNPLLVGVQPDETEQADFGFNSNKMASIGDTVFEDLDADGIQESGEFGIEGIQLTLYLDDGDDVFEPSNDTIVGTETTNSAGIYDFTGLLPGTYFVDINVPSGLNNTGSVVYGLPGEPITVADNTDINNADYGLLPSTGEIHGVVFDDINKNGVQDTGEEGHQGFQVVIYGPGPDGDYDTTADNVAVSTVTDPDGAYWQDGLPPGDYVVDVDQGAAPFGSVSTTPDPAFVWLGGGDIVTTNFGIMLPGGVVQGTIFSDDDQNGVQNGAEAGLANVTITLFDLGVDGSAGTSDDGPSRIVTTAANGAYIIEGLPDSNYLLSVDDPVGMVATSTEPRPVTISGGTTENEDIGYATAKMAQIGDTVFQDLNGDGDHDIGEPGIDDVTVTLYQDADEDGFLDASEVGIVVATTTTNSAGIYNFPGLMPGFYLVAATEPSQHTATGDTDPLAFEVIAGQIVETADFGFLPTGGSISGIVFDDADGDGVQGGGELGLGGVEVTVTSDGPDGLPATGDEVEETVDTNADGTYAVTSLPPGDYTVAFETPDGTEATTPNPETLELGANEAESLQTGFAPVTGTIDGIVFNDLNGNGVKDANEGGVGNVTLNIFGPGPDSVFGTADDEPAGTTVSAANGGYWFTDVPVGPYRLDLVDSTAPTGFSVSTGNDPSDLVVEADQATTVLFGLHKSAAPKATIAGKVFNDKDKNGQYGGPDVGFPAVTVKLFTIGADYKCGTADDDFKAQTTTNGDGNYSFNGLHPGTYCVLVHESTLPGDASPTTGGNPATVYVEAGQTREANFGYAGDGKIDLELTKTGDKTGVAVGEEVTFTIKVKNTHEAHVAATNVIIKDHLPTGLQYVWNSATTGQGLVFNPTQLTWQIEWIGVGQEVELSLKAIVNRSGEFKNCAEVWAADQPDKDSTPGSKRGSQYNPNASREDDEDCHRVWTGSSAKIDLELDKSVDKPYPTVGSKVTYTLSLSNTGSIAATNVMVTEYLPQGVSYVWGSATTATGITFNASKLTWTLPTVGAGETVQLQLQATVNQAGEWANYAEVWDADQVDADSETGDERGTPFNPYAPREDDEAEANIWVGTPPATDAICYVIADNENTPWNSKDVLSKLTSQGRVETIIGRTGTLMIESMAFNPWTGVLYAADANSLGTINLQTGHYTDIGEFGYGEGWMANGEYRTRGLLDADGLAFDALNGDLWASSRKTGEPDLLFKINPATGAHVPEAFGPGKDFISILTNDGLNDIDDIAIDPTNGKLYAINNEGGTQSRLVTIDKQTGWITEIRDLPIGNIEGLDFFGDGTLYATAGEGDEAIVIIDKATLTTQIVTSIGTGGNRDYEAIACLTSPANNLRVTVFEDVNNDGQQNGVEVPLVGVDVQLYRDVDGDGLVSADDPMVQTGLSDSNGEVTFSTAAKGKFVYRMAGGFVRGVGIQTGANVEGFGLLSRSYMAIGASTSTGADDEPEVPAEYQLYRNYPNPFNPATTISFDLPQTERVTLTVFDVLGRQVAVLMDGVTEAGHHEVRFDGRRLASGTYVYRMATPTRTMTRSMVLVK